MNREIMINDIFRFSNKDLSQYKLNLDCQASGGGESPLEVWVADPKKWLYDWLRYRDKDKKRERFNGAYVLALIKFPPDEDSWLFVGYFKVLDRTGDHYKLHRVAGSNKYEGRLVVKFKRPGQAGTLNLKRYLHKLEVKEILRERYSGEAFPGYEKINHDFRVMKVIFDNQREDWKLYLSSINGVYLYSDEENGNNGKRYVGSAYGKGGIWERWAEYIENGHGGNKELERKIEEEGGIEYARNSFKFSLLEWEKSTHLETDFIIEREKYWKDVLLTGDERYGYNKN